MAPSQRSAMPRADPAEIRARYIVGCDGGASSVRRQLGIQLRGEGNLLRLHQALYYCPMLYDRIPIGDGPGRGRHYHVADGQATFLIMQDSTRHWTLHVDCRTAGRHGPAVRADGRHPGAVRDAATSAPGSRTCCWRTGTVMGACFSPVIRPTW